jgi:hypothetical protein
MKYRHQAVIPFAILYILLLLGLGLVGPMRIARAFLRDIIKGSGKVIQQSRPVSGFNAVVVSGIGELSAVQGNTESLTVEAEDNIAPALETEVKDDCLYIRIKRDTNIQPTKPIRYSLTTRTLNRVGISGAVKANFGKLESDSLKLSASGASKAAFDGVRGNELTADLSGASSVSIAGDVQSQKLNLSGAAHYAGDTFSCKTADIEASGASHADIQVSNALTVRASGASSVRYKGSPHVTRSTSGAASVQSN